MTRIDALLRTFLPVVRDVIKTKFSSRCKKYSILWACMSSADQQVLPFNLEDTCAKEIFTETFFSARRKLLRERDSNVDRARKRLKRLVVMKLKEHKNTRIHF